ncbi:MAG: hypothetical protein LBT40_00675, partial [Deltaproteobacteria bacterium]|nr:hypothetical protein [Deltaproteobacteria bacterium]
MPATDYMKDLQDISDGMDGMAGPDPMKGFIPCLRRKADVRPFDILPFRDPFEAPFEAERKAKKARKAEKAQASRASQGNWRLTWNVAAVTVFFPGYLASLRDPGVIRKDYDAQARCLVTLEATPVEKFHGAVVGADGRCVMRQGSDPFVDVIHEARVIHDEDFRISYIHAVWKR